MLTGHMMEEPTLQSQTAALDVYKRQPLGNNNLEAFLRSEDCEVMVPGLMNFIIFMSDHHVVETKMFGVKHLKGMISGALKNICNRIQETCYSVLRQYPCLLYTSCFPFLTVSFC